MRALRILQILFLTVALLATVMLINIKKAEAAEAEEMKNLAAAVTTSATELPKLELEEIPPEEETITPLVVDFAALQAINADISGWVRIDGTAVDYPILQGKDNEQYSRRSYTGAYARSGSIFLDWRVDEQSRVLLMYGHNMGKAMMFSELTQYQHEEYYVAHPEIALAFPGHTQAESWRVFAVCFADAHQELDIQKYFSTDFEDEEAYLEYIGELYSSSIYITEETEVPIQAAALATCLDAGQSSSRRIVVYAGLFD